MNFWFEKSREKNNKLYIHLHNLTCLKVVHSIEYEYVDLNIKFQLIINNTNSVILFKKIPHFDTSGHDPPPPRNNFSFKTFYLRPIQYFSILINTLYFILNVFENNVDPILNNIV